MNEDLQKYEATPQRWGIVLEGGGLRGVYTAGVLDVLMEHRLFPQVICGTSAGVTVGSNMKSNQPRRMLKYSLKYADDPRYISIRSWLKTGNIVNEWFAYREIPYKLEPFDFDTFKRSPIEFYATVTNMRTGRAEHKRITDARVQMPLMQATASLPFLSRPVQWGDEKYLDGGIADNIPLKKCLSLGCNKVLVVLTHPMAEHKTSNLSLLARICYSRYSNLIHDIDASPRYYERLLKEIQDLEAMGKVFVVAPKHHLEVSRLEHNRERMKKGYMQGYEDMTRRLDELLNYLKK